MHHVATITKTSNKHLPFHAQCSCGPAGDFSVKESAEAFLRSHLSKQGGISTQELVDKSDEEVVEKPVPPLTHAASASVTDELPAPVEGVAGEAADPSTQISAESEANWPKKKKK